MSACPDARFCGCGCGQSIAHMSPCAKWHPVCKARIEREKKAYKPLSPEAQLAKRLRRLSAATRSNVVYREFRAQQPRAAEKRCHICAGLPWAREPGRRSRGNWVIDASGKCRGCGEGYAQEPAPERSLITSSAGTAATAGRLYGFDFIAPRRSSHV